MVSAGVLTSLCFTAGPLDSWMYPWGFLAAAGAAAFGVASLVAPPGWAERLFAHPVLVGIGRRSYGIYLWHFDWMKRSIASAGGLGQPSWPGWVRTPLGDSSFPYLLVVGLGAGMAFAAVSWYLLEEPLQRFKGGLRRRSPRGALGAAEASK